MRYELFICQRNRGALEDVRTQRSELLRAWPHLNHVKVVKKYAKSDQRGTGMGIRANPKEGFRVYE